LSSKSNKNWQTAGEIRPVQKNQGKAAKKGAKQDLSCGFGEVRYRMGSPDWEGCGKRAGCMKDKF